MHSEVIQNEPGNCPLCGMALVKIGQTNQTPAEEDYTPLVVVFGVLAVAVASLGYRDTLMGVFSWHMLMMYFMAGMFLIFSTFKLLDLQGFKEGYGTYDLIAKRLPFWGYLYPFIELGLGLLYLVGTDIWGLNLFVFVLMLVNGLGVSIKLLKKEKFQCACLGTFLKVPLTKVSLAEDFGMALMALYMML
jgi:hypothetical protein